MRLMPENVNYQITAVSVTIYGNHCILPNRVYTFAQRNSGTLQIEYAYCPLTFAHHVILELPESPS